MSLKTFTEAYIECALWAECANTTDNDDRSIGHVAELAPETRAKMESDCAAFYAANEHLFPEDAYTGERAHHHVDAMAGHDFWLTRNGHGAGFWDSDWAEPAANLLTQASKQAGSCDLYIGDDGMIYQG